MMSSGNQPCFAPKVTAQYVIPAPPLDGINGRWLQNRKDARIMAGVWRAFFKILFYQFLTVFLMEGMINKYHILECPSRGLT